jgi:hypothetical protein
VEKFSLISAIIGGFITAAFTYLIHILLLKRSEKRGQERMALLYLVRISQIVAIRKALESVYKEEIDTIKEQIKGLEIIKGKGTDYALHLICVGFTIALQNNSKVLDITSNPDMRRGLNILKSLLDKDRYLGYKIDDQILSNLPSDAILKYHFFIDLISSISSTLSQWISAIESNDFSLLDANTLFQQIMSFKKVVDNAEALRSSLIIKARIRRKKAAGILAEQLGYYAREMATFEKHKKIIGIFKDWLDKGKQDKKTEIAEKG